MRKIAAVLVLLFAAVSATAATPAAELRKLEHRLDWLGVMRLRYQIESTGVVASAATGSLDFGNNRLLMESEVTLNGAKRNVVYAPDEAPSRATRRAILFGMTRMGLLHNLVRLYGDKAIDPTDKTIDEWVKPENVTWDPAERLFTFDIVVDGSRAGRARLWLDKAGMPVRREQRVQFPQGEMVVTELYTWL